jgi:uncharacterized protein YjiS (DUF1127 family)
MTALTMLRVSFHLSRKPAPLTAPVLIHEVWRRWWSRRDLVALDDRMLRDIGATRAEAQHELSKPFWRI